MITVDLGYARLSVALESGADLVALERRLNDIPNQSPLETYARFIVIAALLANKSQSNAAK